MFLCSAQVLFVLLLVSVLPSKVPSGNRGCVLRRTCVGDAQPPYVMEHANAQWYMLANYRGII